MVRRKRAVEIGNPCRVVSSCGGQRAIGFDERDDVGAARAGNLDQAGVGDRGGAPRMGTAPALMKILPAASRLAAIALL
jgi:hypothetical protein